MTGSGRAIARTLRDAARTLRRSPLFAVLAVLSLGFALGVDTTAYALVDAALHPTTPIPEPERVATVRVQGGDPRYPTTYEQRYEAIDSALRPLGEIGSVTLRAVTLQSGAHAEGLFVASVTPGFFDILGVRPWAGRVIRPGSGDGAVISFRLWRRLFASRPVRQGIWVTLGARTVPVIGVLPPDVHVPAGTDVWVPDAMRVGDAEAPTYGPIPVVRLSPGVTRARAGAALVLASRRLDASFGSGEQHPVVATLRDFRPEPAELADLHRLLVAAAAIVLLVSCANLGTLLLARAAVRRREIALRIALGASRRRVMADVFAETGLLVAGGAAVGALVAAWSLALLSKYGARGGVAELGDVTPALSARGYLFMLLAAAVTAALAGVLPALRAASTAPATPLKDGAGATRRLGRGHHVLLVFQVSCAMTLLVAAGLMLDSNGRLRRFRFDYAARDLLVASVDLRPRQFPDSAAAQVYGVLTRRAAALPGAAGAATVAAARPAGWGVVAENGRSGERTTPLEAYSVVSAAYLRTVGIPIVAGRDFDDGDEGGAGVVVVDEVAARSLWRDVRSPVGRMIKLGRAELPGPWYRVVGVARRVDRFPRRDTDASPPPVIYLVDQPAATRARQLVVRSRGPETTASLAIALDREIRAVAPQAVAPVRLYLEPWTQSLTRLAFLASLFTALGGFALLLAALGLYGLLTYTVSQRASEYAVRMAIGADRRTIARQVLREVVVLALAGIGLGAFVALAAARRLDEQLLVTPYSDVAALVAAEAAVLLAVAWACVVPVRRATRVEPAEALRAL